MTDELRMPKELEPAEWSYLHGYWDALELYGTFKFKAGIKTIGHMNTPIRVVFASACDLLKVDMESLLKSFEKAQPKPEEA